MKFLQSIRLTAGVLFGLISCLPAHAEISNIPLLDPTGATKGTARIVTNPFGPDEFSISMSGIAANTRYTVFLTQSKTTGALPAQYVGEFTSGPDLRAILGPAFSGANASFTAITEVVDAFASHNTSKENALGTADVLAAGAIANGANTISLNWIRIYLANGTVSVFGTSDAKTGGGLAFTSASAIPTSRAVVAHLKSGSRTEADVGFGPAFISDSAGNIVQYSLKQTAANGSVTNYAPQTSPLFVLAPQGCPGVKSVFTLTVVDSAGLSDSFDQTVTFVRPVNGGGIGSTCN